MVSVLARVQCGCRAQAARTIPKTLCLKRGLHQTPVALKKQQNANQDDGDLFRSSGQAEDVFSDDLFGDASETVSETSAAGPSSSTRTGRGKLSPEERLTRFNDLRNFVHKRIGRNTTEKLPPVRNSAWTHLFQLATTKEQLEEVVEMFPRWRDSKRKFHEKNTEAFVRRCEELKCPALALKVFSDHPKYGLDLSSLPAARRLLHALQAEHDLQDTITLAALFRVYNLPPISSDLVSCAVFTAACFQDGSKQSSTVAREMLPHLKRLLEKVEPEMMQLPKTSVERARDEAKEKAWVASTMAKVREALGKEGSDLSWLDTWRQASGHEAVAT